MGWRQSVPHLCLYQLLEAAGDHTDICVYVHLWPHFCPSIRASPLQACSLATAGTTQNPPQPSPLHTSHACPGLWDTRRDPHHSVTLADETTGGGTIQRTGDFLLAPGPQGGSWETVVSGPLWVSVGLSHDLSGPQFPFKVRVLGSAGEKTWMSL
jgi:hypothetical protein